MKLLITAIFLGNMQVTAYQPKAEYTDSSPCITANGKPVHMDGVAISRDLHDKSGGSLSFGDAIYIEGVGIKIVNDVMNSRFRNSVDIFVWTKKEESQIWKRFGLRKQKVWKIKMQEK